MPFSMRALYFWTSLLLANSVTSLPTSINNETDIVSESPATISRRSLGNGVQLRILCLGASIVMGAKSTDSNGFRYPLRNQLVAAGNPVNMIGSQTAGSMIDNEHEGWPGLKIGDMIGKSDFSIPSQPNLVLIQVGSNDMSLDNDVGNAHLRLAALIDHIFDKVAGVTIIASTLLPRGDGQVMSDRTKIYNDNIPGIIRARQVLGKKITYVDFSSSWFSTADLATSDPVHPSDTGYKKMAAVWYQGIQVADGQGWLTPPAALAGVSDVVNPARVTTCDKIIGNVEGPFKTQMGSGDNDGPYVHVGTRVSDFSGFTNPSSVGFNNPLPEGVFWADINGDGIDDYVYMGSVASIGMGVALSLGGGNFGAYNWAPMAAECPRAGIRFADITGTGRDDFCCLADNGDLTCWENTPGSDARVPKWVSMGLVKGNQGYSRAQVRLADIDGDGRADYIGIDAAGGKMFGWRNDAIKPGRPDHWTGMNGAASGLPILALSGWRFVDLNGDHKDDLVWVDNNGKVTTWINQRGFTVSYTPSWQSMGVTHGGGTSQRNVTFGAFMGSGRADYSEVKWTGPGLDAKVLIERYRNDDSGGTRVRADGSKYCDMTGDGKDDYIWVSNGGGITVFGNTHNWGTWTQYGVVYETRVTRRDIHFADFDGDGKCDILLVNKANGATTVLRNDFANGKFAFTNIGVVTGSATCTEGYGYLNHDMGVHWNDLTGNGRADFLCMQSDGTLTGYLNEGVGKMTWQDFRIADIDGNMGFSTTGVSAFAWVDKGTIAGGANYRGSAIELPNLNGLGRADNLAINPQTNEAWVLLNICPGGVLGPVEANLPSGAPLAPTALPIMNDIPFYDTTTNHQEITEWLAIGDSFSAGISADKQSDMLNSACSRFKMSYPNQMQNNPRFPGHSTSRDFTFGACSGGKMADVVSNQIGLGKPDGNANYPKIGNPQVVTLSISGNDLGFGDIVNNCIYHWFGYHDCKTYLRAALDKLQDPKRALWYDLFNTIYQVIRRARSTNWGPQVQMYVTGYVRFFNEGNTQCNDVSWASHYVDEGKLTTSLRSDMNHLVLQLNEMIKTVVESVSEAVGGGIWFVDEFETSFDGHRFCEVEENIAYHKNPTEARTWFIHYQTPYLLSTGTASTPEKYIKAVDAALIPPKNGISTEDQLKAVGGEYSKINPAYQNLDSVIAAMDQLAANNPDEYGIWPITWTRVMHPKGPGYEQMSNAVINKIIASQAITVKPPVEVSTKALFVYYDDYTDTAISQEFWTFYAGSVNGNINLCNNDYAAQFKVSGSKNDAEDPPLPKGSWSMKLFTEDGCAYANDGIGPGTIMCPGMSTPKACSGGQDPNTISCNNGVWRDDFQEVDRCYW